jgi:hypothetical protein
MGERYYLWVAARLVAGVAIIAWAASYMGTGSGEKEFQKTLDAMKQVHSFREAYTANNSVQHNEMLWEVDCNRDLLHHHWHVVTKVDPPTDMEMDQTNIAGREYLRKTDGTWLPPQWGTTGTARAYCSRLTQAEDSGLLPQIATMIKRGIIQKGDKKTVNGVRCREWKVTLKGGMQGLEHDTICLGLEDRLPYEMTVVWEGSHATFSDYNSPIQIDVPDASVQPASAQSTSSN